MTTIINDQLLTNLAIAQLRLVHELTTPDVQYQGIDNALNSDDSFDDLKSALLLGVELLEMQYDNRTVAEPALIGMLTPESENFIMDNFACGGVSKAVIDAMPSDWEARWEAK